ncbi:MAG: YidC/Oxa1 family membrane protein insertase [Clostridia bacterium]|nr:YidC/Oxa1 family membrane protein insertase [Clostridia bacterium]
MELFNVLATSITVYGDVFDVHLNWIGKLIKLLVSGVGSVGVGIILFSLILKLITLPFDIYQRIAMRKQNIKMKENQAKMEKLQKQYANNKELYNQKVMEMYKESGFSMFSSC